MASGSAMPLSEAAAETGPSAAPTADEGVTDRPTVARLRTMIAAGAAGEARAGLEGLRERLGETSELMLLEASLLAAEGRAADAIARIQRLIEARPAASRLNAEAARLAVRLGAVAEAERLGAILASSEPHNLEGLGALAFAHREEGRVELYLDTQRRIALSPAAPEATILGVLDDLRAGGRWTDLMEVLDRREYILAPDRVARLRAEALLSLGWQRRAIDVLSRAHDSDYLRVDEVFDLLMDKGLLAVAAHLVSRAQAGDPWSLAARARVLAKANEVCKAATIADAPFAFADAIQARAVLLPGREPILQAMRRAREAFIKRAGRLSADGDAGAATDLLVAAARLDPTDVAALQALADAARQAGRVDRHVDTLSRIGLTAQDQDALLAAADSACEVGAWDTLASLLAALHGRAEAVGAEPAGPGGAARWLNARLSRMLDEGDHAGAFGLVVKGRGPWTLDVWPPATIERLKSAAKRGLRTAKFDDAEIIAVCSRYLALDSDDLEVRRVLARLLARQRRMIEAGAELTLIVARDPHVARDWIDLGLVHHESGDVTGRDYCTARAIVLSPGLNLPAPLRPFRDKMVSRDA